MRNWTDNNIIFLISLPRSGSTFVQRVIGAHEKIFTVSETWALMTFMADIQNENTYAIYDYNTYLRAANEFRSQLKGQTKAYDDIIAKTIIDIFNNISIGNNEYFLEKTPRNTIILHSIFRLFPNSKYIFLWRNPLSIIGSMINKFGNGKWKIPYYKVDIYLGLQNMIETYQKFSEQICSVKYEDLIEKPEKTWESVFAYLNIGFERKSLKEFSNVTLRGSLGDHIKENEYKLISKKPINKYKIVLNNPFRKWWCKKYLRWIGSERLNIMGYDLNELLSYLNMVPMTYDRMGSDILRSTYGEVNIALGLDMIKDNMKKIRNRQKIYFHR